MRRLLLALLLAVSGCGLSLPAPMPTVRLAREAPPGTFDTASTFEVKSSFDEWKENDPSLARAFEDGLSLAEHELRRDSFLSNPRLANGTKEPGHTIQVEVGELDGRSSVNRATAEVRIRDRAGAVVEQLSVQGSAEKRHGLAGVAKDVGYRVGLYMSCRTSGKTAANCTY